MLYDSISRQALLGTVLVGFTAVPAHAEEASTSQNAVSAPAENAAAAPDTAPPLQEIVVTGFRSSNARSISAKRDSTVTIDSIAADEIGKLPDFNAADALKRVTGVNTLSYQGEPRYVIVRGLNANYNTTLIDGFAFASADVGSRQVLMEVLPSNFVYRIDVTKTFLPQNDGGSIGGNADLITAGGFDYADNTLTLSGKFGQNLMDNRHGGEEPVGEAAAKWAKRFGTADQLALLTTASYWLRHIHVPQIEAGGSLNWYNANGTRNATPYGGNGFAVPAERRWYNYDNDRDRSGVTTRLDWRPEGSLTGHATGFYFKQHEQSDRNTQNAQAQNSSAVSNQTPTRGTLSNVLQYSELGRLRWDRSLYGINGELKYAFNDRWNADLRGSTSRSDSDNPQTWDKFQQNGLAFSYDWSGLTPTFTAVNAANAAHLSRYANVYHQEEATDYQARVNDFQLNTHYNTDEDSRGVGLAFGARAVATRTETNFVRTNWNTLPYTLADVVGSSSLCGFNCNTSLITIDAEQADELFARFRNTVTPVTDTATQFGRNNDVDEKVSAAYSQAQYRTDRFLLAGGARLEHTRFGTDGFQSTNGAWAPVSARQSSTDVLPSLSGFWNTGDLSKLRFGVSRTLGRPRFDQMALIGGSLNTTVVPNTLSQSNVDLKPRRADNFDLGHEWYLDQGRGILSVAAFHKRIRDEIYRYGQLETLDGTTVLVTQPRNVDGMVKISGLELGVTKELGSLLTALNGFTISTNFTVLDATYPIQLNDGTTTELSILPEQPKQLWNVALYYEQGPVHAKLAWNHISELWDDRFPNYTSQAQFYANRYQQATDNVDLQVAYDLSRNFSISFDALNLTGQGYQYNYGRAQEYVQSAWKLAPSVMVGLSYKL